MKMKSFMNEKNRASFFSRLGAAPLFCALIFVFFASCQTTKFVDERTQIMSDGLEINASDEAFKIYDADFSSAEKSGAASIASESAESSAASSSEKKYIFMRLYLPEYDNKASSVNMLKHLIVLADPNPEVASHSSISFGLDDDFYGLTLYSRSDLKKESCEKPESNLYMKLCNPYLSEQTTLAIEVEPDEYEAAKKMLEKDFAEQKVKYWATKNLIVGAQGFKRKRLPFSKGRLGGQDLKKGYIPSSKKQKRFVCSTYLAYVLQSCVKKVDDYFKARNISYQIISPTDLYYIPGFKILFKSTWVDYNVAAQEFVHSQPRFAKYLTR